jgi:pimeloyl-ACP methyl ester carboxylesterase
MAEAIDGSELVHLPDANHVVPLDMPDRLAEHVLSFLG